MLRTWSARTVALLVAAAGLLGTVGLVGLVGHEPTPQDDDLIYERMAQDPLAPHTYVFAFRVAVPWLVHVLPFSTDLSFTAVGWLMTAAAGAFVFLLLEELGTSRRLAIALAVAFALSPPLLVANLREGRNPDPMTLMVMAAGTLFIVQRRPLALTLTMLAGAFNRETALFLAPLAYAVWAQRPLDLPVLRRTALAALPALAAFVTLRLALPTVGREQVPGYGSPLGGRLDVLDQARGQAGSLVRRLATTYGPLWVVAPFALRGSEFARRGLVLAGLCAVACTFALDWGRVAAVAAPVVYGASAWVLARHPRAIAPTLAGLALLVVGYAAYMQHSGLQNLIDAGPPPYPVR